MDPKHSKIVSRSLQCLLLFLGNGGKKEMQYLQKIHSCIYFQINRAPSFGTDQKIDYDVKRGVLLNALKLLNIR